MQQEIIKIRKNANSYDTDYDYWKDLCNVMDYPITSAFDRQNGIKVLSSHFIRTMNEIKILSIFGKHSWKQYQEGSELHTNYINGIK